VFDLRRTMNRAVSKLTGAMITKVSTIEKFKEDLTVKALAISSMEQQFSLMEQQFSSMEEELIGSRYAASYYADLKHYTETQVQALQATATYKTESGLINYLLLNFELSSSQLLCDLIVGYLFEGKQGTFVEFGAADGVTLSNTYFLEKSLNWTGVVAEPALGWHEQLTRNRSCKISSACIYKESHKTVTIVETQDKMLSTISSFRNLDMHADKRKSGLEYEVETLSLEDFIDLNFPMRTVDFLSIDTEGSEYEILASFDFSRFSFGFIAIEHNFNDNRPLIGDLLKGAGYVHVLQRVSRWDDWWVHPNLVHRFGNLEVVNGMEG